MARAKIIVLIALLLGWINANLEIDVNPMNGDTFQVTLLDGFTKLSDLKSAIATTKGIPISSVKIVLGVDILNNDDIDLEKEGITSVTLVTIQTYTHKMHVFNYGGEYKKEDTSEEDTTVLSECLGEWGFELNESADNIKERILHHYGIKYAGVKFIAVKDPRRIVFSSNVPIKEAVPDMLDYRIRMSRFPDDYKFFLVLVPPGQSIDMGRVFHFGNRI
mmetsp:Transcript_11326/g.14179  ORF Transcript_11326/g.14179 Transcript_11326/m.14179 type:complete len:219 (-) Transcript_11326:13-669(-)